MKTRYARQALFYGIKETGQKKLSNKHVFIVGAGALGTGNAEILARAGVGKISIVDRDYVEWSNLQRQQLFGEEEAENRTPKAAAVKKRLQQINSDIQIESYILDAGIEEMQFLAKDVDLIIDATDNFETRMLINDFSQYTGIPWIFGACVGSYGLTYTIIPTRTPCLQCLLESVPIGAATCDTAGIIAPTVQMVVSYQTSEALKLLVEKTDKLRKTLVSFDLWKNQHTSIVVDKLKRADCPSCGDMATHPFLQKENQTRTAVLCGRDTVQIRPPKKQERNLDTLAERFLQIGGKVMQNPYLVSFTQGKIRLVVFKDGRVLVHGTKDIREAKSLYDRFVS